MENIFLEHIYNFIILNQNISYFIIFIIAVLEAVIFVGLFIPATILIAVLGFVAYEGHINSLIIIFILVLGAVLGDVISFLLGGYFSNNNKLRKIEKIDSFFKKRDYLNDSKIYFEKHGGKSVLLGRFIGFVRPFIAFVAGLSSMNFTKFMFLNFLGAFLWVLLYFYLGYFFGTSLDLINYWVKKTESFLIIITIFLIFLVFVFVFFRNKNKKNNKIKG